MQRPASIPSIAAGATLIKDTQRAPDVAAAHSSSPPALPMASRAQPPMSLHNFLVARCAAVDQMTLALIICLHASILFKGALQPHELLTYRLLLVMHGGSLALLLAAPAVYLRHRSAVISTLRLVDLIVLPVLVDTQRIHQPAGAAATAANSSSIGSASNPAFSLRSLSFEGAAEALHAWRLQAHGSMHAALLFMVAVTRMHACLAAASGAQLPPLLHILVHSTTVGALCLRSPAGELHDGPERGTRESMQPIVWTTAMDAGWHRSDVAACLNAAHPARMCLCAPLRNSVHTSQLPCASVCQRYVRAGRPHNAQLVEGLFWVLRQATSTLAAGSGLALGAASDALSSSQKCVAVTWSLEVSRSKGESPLCCLPWPVRLNEAEDPHASMRSTACTQAGSYRPASHVPNPLLHAFPCRSLSAWCCSRLRCGACSWRQPKSMCRRRSQGPAARQQQRSLQGASMRGCACRHWKLPMGWDGR